MKTWKTWKKELYQQSLLISNQHVINLIWHYDNEFMSWCSYDFVTSTCAYEYMGIFFTQYVHHGDIASVFNILCYNV